VFDAFSPQHFSFGEIKAARPEPLPPSCSARRSPLPRYRGGGCIRAISFSRRVFAPEFLASHCTKAFAPKKIKGGGAPTGALRITNRAAPNRRYRLPMLRARRAPRNCDVTAATRFGRARLSALRRGFPRAALGCTRFGPGRASREREDTGVTRSSFAPKPSTWHPDRNVEGVDTRTARERDYKPRPQEPQPAPSIGCHRLTPLTSELESPCRHPRNSVKFVVWRRVWLLIPCGFFSRSRSAIPQICAPLGVSCESSL
jgi:hypothetical protein